MTPGIVMWRYTCISLQWRHNEQRLDCLLNRLFRRRSKKTSKLCVTGLCEGNALVVDGFPSQRANNAGNVSIWWRHHVRSKHGVHLATFAVDTLELRSNASAVDIITVRSHGRHCDSNPWHLDCVFNSLFILANNKKKSYKQVITRVHTLSYLLRDITYPEIAIKQTRDRLIFNMGIPIPGKDGLYIETGPRFR